MIVYYATNAQASSIWKELQSKRTSNSNPMNFLGCPAVRDGWHNTYAFTLKEKRQVLYKRSGAIDLQQKPISSEREPHLEQTNIFNLQMPHYFFSEVPLKIKVTAPHFHKVSYLEHGTFIGGVFDIGQWFRPVESEIITWAEEGEITFKKDEPLFYSQFLTDLPVRLKRFTMNPMIEHLANGLINSPLQNKENLQGSLQSRYDAFNKSDFRLGLINEIKEALVPEEANPDKEFI